MSDLSIEVTPNANKRSDAERSALIADAGFGRIFTDHMVTINWSRDIGWHDWQLRAREPFSIDPASVVLHYAQEVFEGMKAYKRDDGEIALFRPQDNARRLNLSASRLAMPDLPPSLFIESVERLIDIDRAWVPGGEGALYLRPFMFANDAFLGVQAANHYIFCVIASPVGAYFKGGMKPLSLWISNQFTRAASGGTGAAKCGGNYAAGLIAQAEANANGCDQVVFLDAVEHRWIEELGGMNIFFVMDDGSIRTPELGTILAGVTRASVIELARSEGHAVLEQRYSIDEWSADAASGRLREVFVCGTAATVIGVGDVCSATDQFTIAGGHSGPVTEKIRSRLIAIQRGRAPDPFDWCRTVPAREVNGETVPNMQTC